ncbi:hypothetical protein F0365_15935 [Nonlabens sp. Ci31]|jgi:hypothetical protein|uniref:hypothetical protein n=1 Tax=Nonlabens sp. Ci31 TaxID=2608253 RepID=UPI001463BA0D|nr:hypothetical protein [Nonlabens sp. Ci31]QJP35784.1 hypothetical protein F0365_15935 [Nonlabens sp. Ci31]
MSFKIPMHKNHFPSISQFAISKVFLVIVFTVFSLVSCKEIKKAEIDLELFEAEDLALAIENSLNSYSSDSLRGLFSPALFARRLGSDFKQRPKMERQYLYSIFNSLYIQNMETYVEEAKLAGLEFLLFDVHMNNEVYRLNYLVTTKESENLINYMVLYVRKDRVGDLKVANMYSVQKGFSLAQTIKEFIDITEADSRANIKAEIANQYREEAFYASSLGNYEKAYDLMKQIDSKYLNTSNFAYYKVILSSKVSDSLYRSELEWIRALTSNESSKQFYDCMIQYINDKDDENAIECQEKIQEILVNY